MTDEQKMAQADKRKRALEAMLASQERLRETDLFIVKQRYDMMRIAVEQLPRDEYISLVCPMIDNIINTLQEAYTIQGLLFVLLSGLLPNEPFFNECDKQINELRARHVKEAADSLAELKADLKPGQCGTSGCGCGS